VYYAKGGRTPAKGWLPWAQEQVALADVILVVGSVHFKRLLDQRLDDMLTSHRAGPPSVVLKGDWTDTLTDEVFYPNGVRSEKIVLGLFDDASFIDSIPSFLESCTLYRFPSDETVLCRRLTNQKNSFQRIDVKTAAEFFEVIAPTHERWRNGRWFFRGVSTASWHLDPALFRLSWDLWKNPASRYFNIYLKHKSIHDPSLRIGGPALAKDDSARVRADALAYRAVEWFMLRDFLRAANLKGFPVPDFDYWWTTAKTDEQLEKGLNEFGRWPIDRIIHQLAFAQHHSVPTRLLDWSVSSYSASWFAVSNAVEALYLRQNYEGTISYKVPDDACFCVWAINESSGELVSKDGDVLEFIEPGYQLNARINAQKGVFTLLRAGAGCLSYGVEKSGHDLFIKEKVPAVQPVLVQIVAPHKIAPVVLESLAQHGVTRSVIYPAVDYVHADFTDLDRAAAVKDMRWLQDPEKYYLPHGSTRIPFALSEGTRKAVETCCKPDESVYLAAIRLFEQGLKAELAAKGPASPSKKTRK